MVACTGLDRHTRFKELLAFTRHQLLWTPPKLDLLRREIRLSKALCLSVSQLMQQRSTIIHFLSDCLKVHNVMYQDRTRHVFVVVLERAGVGVDVSK